MTATLVLSPTQPTAGAITDASSSDSVNLANYKTYDLNVTLSGSGVDSGNTVGDDWQSATLDFKLNTGSFYIADSNPNAHGPILPNKWAQTNFRQYQFDTFLSKPTSFTSGDPNILQQNAWVTNEINVQYGDLTFDRNAVGNQVTYTIARFTISNGANGYLTGTAFSQFGGGVPLSTGTTGFAPEPATLSLLGLGALALVRRPNRRRAT